MVISCHCLYKKIFPKATNGQLATTKNILLKTYNKTTVTQLRKCTVEVEHKNNRKKCNFLVVPWNRQLLLGMSDTDTLNILKINIDLIGAEGTKHAHCQGVCA